MNNIKKNLIVVISVAWVLFQLYTGLFGIMAPMQQRPIHLGFALLLTFLLKPASKKLDSEKLYIDQIVLMLLAILVSGYIVNNNMALSLNIGIYSTLEIIVAFALLLLVIEAARRLIGWTLIILGLVFIAYAYFGPYMPGLIRHPGGSLTKIALFLSLSLEGIYGTALAVCASFIFLFILYAQLLQATGGGQVFIDLALAAVGHVRGGPAKVAIVGSAFFGSISGSAVANVAGTGTFTIPMMKKSGYSAEFAGGAEAVASTGGQFMPPIMGSSAFLIAEILGIAYWKVALYALVPAVLYYIAIFFMVDLEAAKNKLHGVPKDELPSAKEVFKKGWPALISPVLLVYLLAFQQWSPAKAAVWAIIITFVVSMLKKETRLSPKQMIDVCVEGSAGALETSIACATVGIVVGMITMTGLALKLSSVLITAAGGSLILLLLLTTITAIILGMGLPTVACYMVLAVMVAPALIRMGVLPIAAHLFIFYFGIISNITPPVALASYVAAGIAKADFMKTGFQAVKLGLSGFVLPFMFALNPNLIMVGEPLGIAQAIVTASIGIYSLSVALENYMYSDTTVLERAIFFAAAITLIIPELYTDIAGIVLFLVGFAMQRTKHKRQLAH